MKKLVVLLAGLAMFASLQATTGISGVVTNADNGQPIISARVCCRADSSRAYTDSTGSYLISQLTPGTYAVTVGASGFQPDTYPAQVVVVQDRVTPNIDFALHRPPTGGISGHVVNAENQRPIPNAYVYAVGTQYHAYCDSTGYYEMHDILVGKYLLHARASWFVYETYPESVPVVANQVTPNIDFALVPAGIISGRVTSASTQMPIRSATVCASGPNGYAYVTTDTGGRYSISMLLPAGRYRVRVEAQGYQPATYPDSVTVIAGQATENINFALVISGGISGRVTNVQTGAPIYHASVGGGSGSAYTDSNGVYVIAVNPGLYRVICYATGFASGLYPESVLVVQGQVTPDIDFALIPYGGQTGISGRVLNANTQLPIGGATIHAQGPNGSGNAGSERNGSYFISGLPAGRYQVRAEAQGYQPLTLGDSVTVVSGQVREYTNFSLVPNGGPATGISGRVTNYQTGAPIVNATIGCSGLPNVYTDNTGAYFVAASPGRYTAWASADGYLNGIYPESILVQQGVVRESINFALIPTSGLTGIGGRLTDASRMLGIGGGTVVASGPNGNGTATSVRTGGYIISGLPAGRYQVTASAAGYQTAVCPESVTVVAGQVRWTPFYMLPLGGPVGAISGRVTNSQNGQVIAGAEVRAYGPNGHGGVSQGTYGYVIGQLPPGKYWVTASASGFDAGHYADSVEVFAGQYTERIDFQLQPTGPVGRLTGRVTNADNGELIVNALVAATNARSSYQVLQGQQDYHFYLPPGDYWVSATAAGFEPGHYPDSVTVVAGQNTADINFVLHLSGGTTGGISGTVTNAQNGQPIFGALVVATGPGQGYTNTGAHGTYLIQSLTPGTYLVMACASGFQPSAWDTVAVTAGHVTPDVNFALQPSGGGGTGGIAGDVVDSATQRPIHGARVFAWSSAGQGYAYSDSSGNYLVHNLRAGWYRLRTEASGYYPAYYPESVQVTEGQTTYHVNFFLRHVGDLDAGIAGFAYGGYEQTEIAGVRVRVTGCEGSWDVFTDDHGDYLVDGLLAGDYVVEFDASGYSSGQYPDPVTIANGAITSSINPVLYPTSLVTKPPLPVSGTAACLQAFPSPSRGSARLQWQVREAGLVALRVFDNTGRVVRTIQNGYQATGAYSANWDGGDDNGRHVANGIYFYRLDAPGIHDIIKVAVISK
jgi:hypothetical protein